MNIKRFVAPDMRQAIRQVRERLGEDAVILSNKSVDGGVELTAAIDLHESELATEVLDYRIETTGDAPRGDGPAESSTVTRGEDPLHLVQREMSEIREMMRHELGELAWLDLGARRPEQRELMRRLLIMGLDAGLSRRVVAKIGQGDSLDLMWRKALYNLAALLPTYQTELLEQGGIVVLMGPTGVGKTTSLAKLAARFALKHGNRQVGLISVDNYRIGAHDQLLTYGRILDVPVRSATTTEQLDEAIEDMRRRKLILIDTAGMGASTDQFDEQCRLLTGSRHELIRMLVLSATTERSALDRALRLFGGLKPGAAMVTKLDECASLGGMLTTLIGSGLPLAFVGDGQRVPEDLHVARSHALVSQGAEMSSAVTQDPTYLAFASGEQFVSAQA